MVTAALLEVPCTRRWFECVVDGSPHPDLCGQNPIVKTICDFIFPVQVAMAGSFAFVEALVLCQLQVNVGDFISISLGMDAGIFLDVHERSVCLKVGPEITFCV